MRLSLGDMLIVFAGGGIGALLRWLTSGFIEEKTDSWLFPWGTLTVNLLGSFLLGFVMGAQVFHGVFSRPERLFIATGFAGAFTTFSTFMYESLRLLAESPKTAIANITVSLLLGLLAVYTGYVVAGVVYRG